MRAGRGGLDWRTRNRRRPCFLSGEFRNGFQLNLRIRGTKALKCPWGVDLEERARRGVASSQGTRLMAILYLLGIFRRVRFVPSLRFPLFPSKEYLMIWGHLSNSRTELSGLVYVPGGSFRRESILGNLPTVIDNPLETNVT